MRVPRLLCVCVMRCSLMCMLLHICTWQFSVMRHLQVHLVVLGERSLGLGLSAPSGVVTRVHVLLSRQCCLRLLAPTHVVN